MCSSVPGLLQQMILTYSYLLFQFLTYCNSLWVLPIASGILWFWWQGEAGKAQSPAQSTTSLPQGDRQSRWQQGLARVQRLSVLCALHSLVCQGGPEVLGTKPQWGGQHLKWDVGHTFSRTIPDMWLVASELCHGLPSLDGSRWADNGRNHVYICVQS